MKNTVSGQVNETILKALFMEQMPENVKLILTGNKGSLAEIAEQADRSFFLKGFLFGTEYTGK